MDFETPVTPEPVTTPDAFDALENLASFAASVPEGAYVTLRHEANPPVYVPFLDGETSITLRTALDRHHITTGIINAYMDNAQINMDTVLASGSVVTIVGSVKGGA